MFGEVILAASAGTAVEEPRSHVRNLQIDVARGIAIVLVVLGHNRAISSFSPELVSSIFLFHVPLFFLLSGWVQRRESGRASGREAARASMTEAVAMLMRRLLLPCFAFALIVGAAKCVTRDESAAQTALGIVWATGQTLPWSHLWFLPALFLALLTTHLLGKVIRDTVLHWSVAAGLAAVLVAVVSPRAISPSAMAVARLDSFPAPVGLPWSLDLLPLCLVFVCLGRTLRQSPWLTRLVFTPGASVLAAMVFAALIGAAHVDLNMRVFAPLLPALAAAVCGCMLALGVAGAVSRFPAAAALFALLGRHTLSIFILHVSLQKAMLGLLDRWGSTSWAAGLITSATAIAVVLLVDRYVLDRVGLLRSVFLGRPAS
jgi:polysaccharide biosynthesis protein PslL